MSARFRWLLLFMVPWFCGCATTGVVRIELEGRPPVVHEPPSDTKAIAVGQREFLETVSRLVLDSHLLVDLQAEVSRLQPSVWRGGRVPGWSRRIDLSVENARSAWGRFTLLGTASPQDVRDRFSLVGAASFLSDEERQAMALSYALDTVWEGVAEAVGATVDPVALKAMISSALCAYMMMLVLPEPVSKFIAIALSAYLVAYLGCGPLWNIVDAYKELRGASLRATSLGQLEEAGHRFGRVMGDNGGRVAIMVVLSAVGGRMALSNQGPTLPGFARAAVAAKTNGGFRLQAVAEGGIRAITVQPGVLTVSAAPSAVATTTWAMSGDGGPKPKGHLTGRPSSAEPGDNETKVRSHRRENESAKILVENGYDVEQNPPTPPGTGKRPDYKVNGEYADCYAPTSDRVRNIAKEIEYKINQYQASRIVLNLEDSPISIETMNKQITEWPIQGLQELFVIKNGQLMKLLPK